MCFHPKQDYEIIGLRFPSDCKVSSTGVAGIGLRWTAEGVSTAKEISTHYESYDK